VADPPGRYGQQVLSWYQTYFVDTGRSAALWLIIGFLVTFAITRGITLKIRARNAAEAANPTPVVESAEPKKKGLINDIHIGGVHVHHQVWGILLVLVVGLIEFRYRPDSPWAEVLGALFGVGAALALDEFALWLHLEDVYWSAEGRKSIDAIMVAAVVGLGLLMGASPIGLPEGTVGKDGLWFVSVLVVVHIGFTVICLLKGKLVTGLVGLPNPFFGVVGAIRLAKPSSFWAKRFYDHAKMARAEARFAGVRHERLDSLKDKLAGPGPDVSV
jgi:hypothetical protein